MGWGVTNGLMFGIFTDLQSSDECSTAIASVLPKLLFRLPVSVRASENPARFGCPAHLARRVGAVFLKGVTRSSHPSMSGSLVPFEQR